MCPGAGRRDCYRVLAMPVALLPDASGVLAALSADLGFALAAVVVLGVGAQWAASHLGVPSILLLLAVGVVAGPDVADVVDPDAMLGDLLFPAVSLAVGILLFEGGLGLRVRDVGRERALPILRLVTIGIAVTWAIAAFAGHRLVGLDRDEAILLGAILVVSGPTVVTPLLRFARVREPVNNVLRWEGILIDPIGAILALVVVQAMTGTETMWAAAEQVATTAGAGLAVGLLGAALLTLVFHRHWVPDELHNPLTLAFVAAAFASADQIEPEAGLFATTVMGVGMANQPFVQTSHMREFAEHLGPLIIGGLFVVLGARVELGLLGEWAPEALGLLAVLVLVARPATVWVSTVSTRLTRAERAYLSCMAPRGIVAASVSALFALHLDRAGAPAEALVPVTFMVIIGTVVVYGFAARPAAVRLGLARPPPRGVALIGGPRWALDLGEVLTNEGVSVIVVTRDPYEAAEAAARGLLTYTQRLDAEDLQVALDAVGVAAAIATSRTEELNAYGIVRAMGTVGRSNVYHLPRHGNDDTGEVDAESRRPFAQGVTQASIEAALARGGQFVVLGADDFDRVPDAELDGAVTLFTIEADERLAVATGGGVRRPPAGGRGVYLVRAPLSVRVGGTPDAGRRTGRVRRRTRP